MMMWMRRTCIVMIRVSCQRTKRVICLKTNVTLTVLWWTLAIICWRRGLGGYQRKFGQKKRSCIGP